MDNKSVGEILKYHREEAGFSIEQVSRATHISIRLIKAMESEQFDEFTSEMYLIGFIKTYASFLNIDGVALVKRYRSMQVQEQPTPLKELFDAPRTKKKFLVLLYILLFAALAGTAWIARDYIFDFIARNRENSSALTINEESGKDSARITGNSYVMRNGFIERAFYENDTIVYRHNGVDVNIRIDRIARNVSVSVAGREISLQNNERRAFDLDQDEADDIEIVVQEILREGRAQRTLLRIAEIRNAIAQVTEQPQDSSRNYGQTKIASRIVSSVALGAFPDLNTIPVELSFTAKVFLQYQSDNQERIANIYEAGDILILQPINSITIWTTNAGNVQMTIANKKTQIGTSGQIASFVIEKEANNLTNTNDIRIVPLY